MKRKCKRRPRMWVYVAMVIMLFLLIGIGSHIGSREYVDGEVVWRTLDTITVRDENGHVWDFDTDERFELGEIVRLDIFTEGERFVLHVDHIEEGF